MPRPQKIKVNCFHCGQELERQPSRLKNNPRQFCDRQCLTAWKRTLVGSANKDYERVEVHCTHCGKVILRAPAHAGRSQNNFCDMACYAAYKRTFTGEKNRDYKRISVPCAHCGKMLERKPSETKKNKNCFCDMDCYTAYQRGLFGATAQDCVVKCSICGKEMKRHPSHARKSANPVCSPECHAAYKRTLVGEKNPTYSRVDTQCANCGNKVTRKRHLIDQREHFFCSKKCSGEWRSKNIVGVAHPTWKQRVVVTCATCGTELQRESWEVAQRKNFFCDTDCMGEWQSQHVVGNNHPRWRGGYKSYYGPNWYPQQRNARQRDKHTCRHCGHKHKKGERLFDVHHIQPFRTFGYVQGENDNYKQANALTNLVTLCAKCHQAAEHGNASYQLNLL